MTSESYFQNIAQHDLDNTLQVTPVERPIYSA